MTKNQQLILYIISGLRGPIDPEKIMCLLYFIDLCSVKRFGKQLSTYTYTVGKDELN